LLIVELESTVVHLGLFRSYQLWVTVGSVSIQCVESFTCNCNSCW